MSTTRIDQLQSVMDKAENYLLCQGMGWDTDAAQDALVVALADAGSTSFVGSAVDCARARLAAPQEDKPHG